ncbi:class I SAM-dependent methyltransferase [Aeromicrobium terrae]|uniref:Class I SAM-dependent methyltransferase n=1 Tax=Aeromicrobium terrae TaxID=2498846 RepID=A0A5C8NH70_9ACTN|nr:class I SAM-dependent methyltransferase [Aeromicrobium terrae]TXL61139.1 class I SAM-dependent methyltransferase [Aeromicrobium terrae]
MFRRTDAAVSPTALYTGTVWRRNGLSHPAFATTAGQALWASLAGPRHLASAIGAPDLDALLLARHHAIDTLLERAIEAGEVSQVVEIASGLSPRGWRFATRHPDLTYVETDLPDMARRKERILRDADLLRPGHRVRVLDAFATDGPDSLPALAEELDPTRGTAVITEGLINYFPMDHVRTLWDNVGTALRGFPRGLYLSDIHLDHSPGLTTAVSKALITVFVRGEVYLHFADEAEAVEALKASGFDHAQLLRPSSFESPTSDRRGVDRNLIIRASSGAA